jgi:hypothetical protein
VLVVVVIVIQAEPVAAARVLKHRLHHTQRRQGWTH